MLRLCLILLAAFSAYSCRTDQFHENETYSDSSKFQLTSQRISLNESKHKSLLVPELEKAEAAFKNSKTNVVGRVINYENGVSIDTDDVIYIENGPNYHTYTFHIKRENASADAPLENLLLSPLPEGGYKEFLITYYLTALEKEKLQTGLPVDTNGKTLVTELANGTFNSGGQLARFTCGEVSETIWVECSQHVHNQSNVEDWVNCKATVGPSVYTIVTFKCWEENDDIITPDPGGGGSSGGGGGGSTPGGTTPPPNNPPCTGTTIPTNPEAGFTDENGCPIGFPSLPNFPTDEEKTSCDILKENSANPVFQGKLDSLKNRTVVHKDPHETVVNVKKAGAKLIYNVSAKPADIGIANTTAAEGEVSNYDIASMHNHPKKHLPIFSFGDIVGFYSNYKYVAPVRKHAYTYYVTNENGTTYALRMNDVSALDALFAGLNLDTANTTDEEKFIARDKMRKLFKKHGEDDFLYDQIRAEKLFMSVLNDPEVGGSNGMHVYRKDDDGWGKLKMDANGNVTKENCPL